MCWRWYNKARICRTSFTWCLEGPPAFPVRSEWHEHWPSMWTISTYQSSVIEPILSHDFQFSTPWEFCKFSRVQPFSFLFSIHLLFLDVEQDTEAVIFNSVISACETLGPLQGDSSGSEDGDGKLETLQFSRPGASQKTIAGSPDSACCMLYAEGLVVVVVCGLWFVILVERASLLYFNIFFSFWDIFWYLVPSFSAFPCFASPPFCFSLLASFFASLLLCFSALPASLPLCLSAFLFVCPCFSAFPASLLSGLPCFSAYLLFC